MVNEYFLSPNFTTAPPPEGPIQLGSILRNITEFEPLNQHVVPIPATELLPAHTQNLFEIGLHQLHSANFSLKAEALGLLGLGTGASIQRTKDSSQVISCEHLETHAFNPTDSYIEQSMDDRYVSSFMRSSRFRIPVYMVTGLKIARGASATSDTSRQLSFEQDTGLLIPGSPAVVGVGAGYGINVGEAVRWGSSTDFIVAFKVKKIWLGRKGQVKHQAYRKRAVMQGEASTDDDMALTLEFDDKLTREEVEEMFTYGA